MIVSQFLIPFIRYKSIVGKSTIRDGTQRRSATNRRAQQRSFSLSLFFSYLSPFPFSFSFSSAVFPFLFFSFEQIVVACGFPWVSGRTLSWVGRSRISIHAPQTAAWIYSLPAIDFLLLRVTPRWRHHPPRQSLLAYLFPPSIQCSACRMNETERNR